MYASIADLRMQQPPTFEDEWSPYEEPNSFVTEWITKLKVQWCSTGKKSIPVTKVMNDFFSCSINPYESALRGMAAAGDLQCSRATTVAYFVMDFFLYWKNFYHCIELPPPSRDLKIGAFKIVTKQRNINLVQIVVDAFHLKSDKHLLLDRIKQLIRNGLYKEACQSAVLLELYEGFTVEDFIVPLIFQDKLTVAQEFLDKSVSFQLEITEFLDNLLGSRNVRTESLRICRSLRITESKMDKFNPKCMAKTLKKIIALYKISPDMCPNLAKKKAIGAVHFLLRKRFIERTIGLESWTEMMEEVVGDDRDLQLELICGIASYGTMEEAFAYADKYHISRCRAVPKSYFMRWEPKPEETDVVYHTLKLDRCQIHIIDTVEDLGFFLDNTVDDIHTCGLDCEWKPALGLRKSILALIQIATRNSIFIIDMWKLFTKIPLEMWNSITTKIFRNPDLLKIGFAFNSDFSIIQESMPWMKAPDPQGPGFLDLLAVWRRLVNNYNFRFPFADEATTLPTSESLNRLVELTLGGRLDKSDQFSNWERRPLREKQITYAALDAFCLLEVYDALELNCANQNIPFSQIVYDIMDQEIPAQQKKKKKNKKSA